MAKKALTITAADMNPSASPRAVVREPGEPLNFRVPPAFGLRFRMYALQNRMKLTDLLIASFNAYEASQKPAE